MGFCSGTNKWFNLFLFFTVVASSFGDIYENAESELTITVEPGKVECFFQNAKPGQILEIEYQVLDSTFGNVELQQDLDITFHLKSPTGKELLSDFQKSDAVHRHEVKELGDHTLCFDNSVSHFAKKTIYFEVYVDNDEDDNDRWNNEEMPYSPELIYNDTMNDIKEVVKRVHDNMNRVKHFQDQVRALEARDRNLQEHNFTQVNNFSVLIIFVMMIVGAVQVLMVRSLFEEKSKLHKIFKLLS